MSKINLMIDEENELTFQVQIEGTRPGTAKCRLMLESNSMSLAFEGQSSNDEVSVTLPPLDHILKEGVYDMTLEVVVDDRFFEPLKLQGEFEKRLKVRFYVYGKVGHKDYECYRRSKNERRERTRFNKKTLFGCYC